jgi:integrase
MAYVYKRPDSPYWWVGYTDEHGQSARQKTDISVNTIGSEAEAECVAAAICKRVKAAEKVNGLGGGIVTFSQYVLKRWLPERKLDNLSSDMDDASRARNWLIPNLGSMALDEIRPHHASEQVRLLKQSKLAERTQRNVCNLAKRIFDDAVADGLIRENPWQIKRRLLPKKRDANAQWREGAVYEATEILQMIRDPRIPEDRRVFYAIAFFAGGARFGEVAALKVSDYERELEPLGKITIANSYNTKKKVVKDTKTGRVRVAPVHPILRGVLDEWMRDGGGLEQSLGRKVTQGDLISPSREGKHRSVNHMLKRFHEDMERIGLSVHIADGARKRGLHDIRATFISLALASGASAEMIRWITHGGRGTVFDGYTRLQGMGVWPTFCQEILKLDLGQGVPEQAPASNSLTVTHGEENPEELLVLILRGGRDSNPRPPP